MILKESDMSVCVCVDRLF